MQHSQPPFGMTHEITQVRTKEYTSGYRHGYSYTETGVHPSPDSRPACYIKTGTRPCITCPWKPDCVNAETK